MMLALALCAAGVCAVLWTILGYPVLLAIRAARMRDRVEAPMVPADDAALPTVTAIIPVHNGGRFLGPKLTSVLASAYPPDRLDVIVLSDGSTDDTAQVAATFADSARVRFVSLPKGGKAAAINAALPLVAADVLLLTDVRQRLEPGCVRALIATLADPAIGVVSGTLRIHTGETSGEAGTGLYWRYESWIRTNLSHIDSLLGATGPIYAMRRSLARPLPPGCILDDMWLPLQAVFAGKRSVLSSDAIAWDYPTSLDAEFTRKVRTQAGLYQLLRLEPRVLSPRHNRLFGAFVNLKLLRLFLGHALLLVACTSVFLPAALRTPLLIAQGLFYGAALLDRLLGEGSPLKRLTTPVAAFVTLVTAAFCAQVVFFRDPATLWKTTRVRDVGVAGGAE